MKAKIFNQRLSTYEPEGGDMKRATTKLGIGLASLAALLSFNAGPLAMAHSGGTHYQTMLRPLNGSADSGNALVDLSVEGNKFTVRTTSSSPGLAHAQHIHIGGTNSCPDISADKDKDGLISTTEGEPSYGPIEISLTTSGDTSKDSGLAVDRFPTANADGTVTYERTFPLPNGVTAEMIGSGVVVTHGVAEIGDDKTKYDGAKKSDIPKSENLPLEATIPATCGKLAAVPGGGVGAGGGSTSGIENAGLIGVGAVALAGAGTLLFFRKRKGTSTS